MFYPLLTTYYILFAILAWRRPPWAVLFVVATLPTYLIRFHIGPVPTTLLEGMVIIVVLVWFIRWLMAYGLWLMVKTIRYTLYAIRWPLALFLIAATASMFVAPDLRAAAGIWKAYFIEPVLFFMVLRDLLRNSKLEIRNLVAALSLTALLLSAYAIFQRFTGFGIPPPWDAELRVTSIFPYPNALALFLAPLVPLFVAQVIAAWRRESPPPFLPPRGGGLRWGGYWFLITAASMLAIIFAKSTGAIVGVGAGVLVMSLLHLSSRGSKATVAISTTRKRLPRSPWSLAMTFVVGIAFIMLLLNIPRAREELTLRNWSGHVRRTQWAETVEMLKDRPILGAGLAGYKETLAPYHKATYLEIFEYPHNIVLNFWSETGLLGLIAFTWLVIAFFRGACPPLKVRGGRGSYELITLGALGAMITLLVHGLVDVPYFKNDLAILFWIVYALGVTTYEQRTTPARPRSH